MKDLIHQQLSLRFIRSANIILGLILLSFGTFSQNNDGMHYGGEETFEYWAGGPSGEEIIVKNGQYWSSSHFTKEYIMYLEMIAPRDMADGFITDPYNQLVLVEYRVDLPEDKPSWFTPPTNLQVYKRGNQGSLYFIDVNTGHMFIYEVQL